MWMPKPAGKENYQKVDVHRPHKCLRYSDCIDDWAVIQGRKFCWLISRDVFLGGNAPRLGLVNQFQTGLLIVDANKEKLQL